MGSNPQPDHRALAAEVAARQAREQARRDAQVYADRQANAAETIKSTGRHHR